jgi:hypothetical protein
MRSRPHLRTSLTPCRAVRSALWGSRVSRDWIHEPMARRARAIQHRRVASANPLYIPLCEYDDARGRRRLKRGDRRSGAHPRRARCSSRQPHPHLDRARRRRSAGRPQARRAAQRPSRCGCRSRPARSSTSRRRSSEPRAWPRSTAGSPNAHQAARSPASSPTAKSRSSRPTSSTSGCSPRCRWRPERAHVPHVRTGSDASRSARVVEPLPLNAVRNRAPATLIRV